MVVIAIVAVTASPYAAARFDEVRKPMTNAVQHTSSSQFMAGT